MTLGKQININSKKTIEKSDAYKEYEFLNTIKREIDQSENPFETLRKKFKISKNYKMFEIGKVYFNTYNEKTNKFRFFDWINGQWCLQNDLRKIVDDVKHNNAIIIELKGVPLTKPISLNKQHVFEVIRLVPNKITDALIYETLLIEVNKITSTKDFYNNAIEPSEAMVSINRKITVELNYNALYVQQLEKSQNTIQVKTKLKTVDLKISKEESVDILRSRLTYNKSTLLRPIMKFMPIHKKYQFSYNKVEYLPNLTEKNWFLPSNNRLQPSIQIFQHTNETEKELFNLSLVSDIPVNLKEIYMKEKFKKIICNDPEQLIRVYFDKDYIPSLYNYRKIKFEHNNQLQAILKEGNNLKTLENKEFFEEIITEMELKIKKSKSFERIVGVTKTYNNSIFIGYFIKKNNSYSFSFLKEKTSSNIYRIYYKQSGKWTWYTTQSMLVVANKRFLEITDILVHDDKYIQKDFSCISKLTNHMYFYEMYESLIKGDFNYENYKYMVKYSPTVNYYLYKIQNQSQYFIKLDFKTKCKVINILKDQPTFMEKLFKKIDESNPMLDKYLVIDLAEMLKNMRKDYYRESLQDLDYKLDFVNAFLELSQYLLNDSDDLPKSRRRLKSFIEKFGNDRLKLLETLCHTLLTYNPQYEIIKRLRGWNEKDPSLLNISIINEYTVRKRNYKYLLNYGYTIKEINTLSKEELQKICEQVSSIFSDKLQKEGFVEKEYENYLFIVPTEPNTINEEARTQSNCVATYGLRHFEMSEILVFMRNKETPCEGYITIRFSNNELVEIEKTKTKYNTINSNDYIQICKYLEDIKKSFGIKVIINRKYFTYEELNTMFLPEKEEGIKSL